MRGTNPARAALSCAAAAVAAAVFGAAILPGAGPARAQAPQAEQQGEPHARIVVTGDGSVPVPPDYAQIRGGVTTRGKTAKEATDAGYAPPGPMMAMRAAGAMAAVPISSGEDTLRVRVIVGFDIAH
jgi:uncharacterized protein YggE